MNDRVVVTPDAWVAPTAILDGEVHIGSGCVIDHGSMIVATGGRIEIGARVVILPGAVIRSTGGRDRPSFPVTIGYVPTEAGDHTMGRGSSGDLRRPTDRVVATHANRG